MNKNLTSSIILTSTSMGWTAAASPKACLKSKFLLFSTNSWTYTKKVCAYIYIYILFCYHLIRVKTTLCIKLYNIQDHRKFFAGQMGHYWSLADNQLQTSQQGCLTCKTQHDMIYGKWGHFH